MFEAENLKLIIKTYFIWYKNNLKNKKNTFFNTTGYNNILPWSLWTVNIQVNTSLLNFLNWLSWTSSCELYHSIKIPHSFFHMMWLIFGNLFNEFTRFENIDFMKLEVWSMSHFASLSFELMKFNFQT